jgi:hypothetical protein
MPENDESGGATEEFNIPITAEAVGFRPEELVVCEKCGRSCPPNRVKCYYCGAEIAVSPDQLRTDVALRRPESWEKGVNVVAVGAGDGAAKSDQKVARMLGIEPDALDLIISSELPLPVARVETATEAALVCSKLTDAGISTLVMTDEELAADDPPRRLRGIVAADDGYHFVHFGGDEVTPCDHSDLSLIVTGAIYERSVTATEARKKGATKIIDSSESSTDESVVDIYLKGDLRGFRVYIKGFDFSVLGEKKGIIGRENLARLVEALASLSSDIVLRDGYLGSRAALAHVWEADEKRDSKGLTRQRFGKLDLSSVSTSSNLTQFTRYSRMLARFHAGSPEE